MLDNLITLRASVTRLRHPATTGAVHSHTVAYISQDEFGVYWLELKCRHDYCKGHLRKRLLPEQMKAWESDSED